jgi:hypothetical protein
MGESFAQKRKWGPLMIANALGPVFLLIVFGALLRRINFPGVEFWRWPARCLATRAWS